MKKIALLLTISMLVLVQVVFAQSKQVAGTVTSGDDGAPLPGVSVVVKGTTIGTVTNVDGKYSFSIPEDAETLIFSFIGMTAKEVAITGSTIDVVLESETIGMEEVIVTGYGQMRKEAYTGSVGVVSQEKLADVPVESVEKALHGKVAGIQVNSTTGQPGSSTQIRIRGFSSINAGMEPLYVIDGVPVSSGNYSYFTSTGNILSTLNPDDIESVTILKDAAAASIYGSRAANGVILITTKSGEKGENNFRVSANYGVSKVTNDQAFRIMDADEIYGYMRAAIVNSGFDPATFADDAMGAGFFASETLPSDVKTFDWYDAAFVTGKTEDIQFSADGGDKTTKYFFSGNYFNQEGIMPATGLKRYSFRMNLDKELNKYFRFGGKFNGTHIIQNDRPNDAMYYANPFWASLNMLPWNLPYVDADGNPTNVPGNGYNFNLPSNANSNFLASAEFDDQNSKQYRALGSVYFEAEPVKGLKFKTLNSIDHFTEEGRRYWSPFSDAPGSETGTLQTSNGMLSRLTTSNTVSYNGIIGDVHSVSALVGQEAMRNVFKNYYASAYDVGAVIPYLSNSTAEGSSVDFGYSEYTLQSYFGNFDYSYDSRYYAHFSLRTDGSSKFGSETRWGNFWSVGGSWNAHNESFIEDVDVIDALKIRASYGINGNDQIGVYDQYGSYSSGEYNAQIVMMPSSLSNPNLGWELNTAYNVGLDFGLWDNKLSGTVEYYGRVTSNMLLDVPISQTSGFGSIIRNVGSMRNDGWEFTLNGTAVETKDLIIDLSANISSNKVEILDLGFADDVPVEDQQIGDGWWRRHRVGGGYSDYYMYQWAGVNPANGEGMWYTAADENGERQLTYNSSAASREFMGGVEPKAFGGFSVDVQYKGFYASAGFEFKVGQYVYIMESRYTNSDGYNWGSNQSAGMLDYWKEPGDVTKSPKPYVQNGTGTNAWGTSRFLYKGDYLRFKDLSVGYNIPSSVISKAGMKNARLYVSGNNLFAWHDVPYFDPERNVTGGGYIIFPQTRTVTFGVEIGF